MAEMRNVYMVGKPERKRPLGRPRHRWEDNIGVHIKEIGWENMNWMDVDRDHWQAFVNTVMNL
jgi:hypothetical protein